MTTRAQLITSVLSSLHSFTGIHEQVTALNGALTDSATTVTVDSADGAKRGVIEIDDELMYVQSVSGSNLTVAPFGRGYRGTTAAAHSDNVMVTFDPMFPRFEIGRAIDQVIASLFPALYQIKTTTLEANAIDVSHELPTDVEQVLRVETKWDGDPADYWSPIVRYEVEKNATPVLNLYEGVVPGWDVRVIYTAKLGALTTDFATSGIPDSYEDLITYGACSRLIRFMEPARLQLGSVENIGRANVVQVGDASKIATQLYALSQQRIAEERRQLLEQYPIRPNYLGR